MFVWEASHPTPIQLKRKGFCVNWESKEESNYIGVVYS